MRKRAQRKNLPYTYEPKHIPTKKTKIEKPKTSMLKIKKNGWLAIALVGIFLMVLLFNTYFNFVSGVAENPEGEGFDKFYLSGPDPYYNMRLVEETYNTGEYPYYSEPDPMLNYPIGRSGGRAPMMNMMALVFSRVLTPFMSEIDALGYAMQFLPALFGALIVFPVYSIGKDVFNKKVGLISALWFSLIPAVVSSGHGSAFSLFDHDSINLFLFMATFAFLIKSIREKDITKSFLYGILGGITLSGLSMIWTEHQFLYIIIALYAFVQIFINIFKVKDDIKTFMPPLIVLFTGYIVSLPVISSRWSTFRVEIPLMMCLGVAVFGIIYYFLGKKKIPWTISLPIIFILGVAGFIFLYFIPELSSYIPQLGALSKLTGFIRGTGGIYANKVSMTIAEASTFSISQTVLYFGAVLFWLGWAGFIFVLQKFYKDIERNDYLFLIVVFIINVWLIGTAGRFITDFAPVIAIFAGFITWYILDKLNFPVMLRNIKSAGGGFHGIRRGVKVFHILGVFFIALSLFLNVIFVFTAAIPHAATEDGESSWKEMFFGEDVDHAFGLSISKESYWVHAFQWLYEQNKDIENPLDRPAVISWWDYGFYEVAIGKHPTVADNFQDGIPPAGNFLTATSEKDGIAVFAIRLIEGDLAKNKGKVSAEVQKVIHEYFGDNADDVIFWFENPRKSPSYGKKISPEYHEYLRDVDERFLKVGAQWPENAYYHDIVSLVNNETHGLTLDEIVMFYRSIQDSTGFSIRYFATEGYDRQIFNIFAYLSDKSLVMLGAPYDDFVEIKYSGYRMDPATGEIRVDAAGEPVTFDNLLLKDFYELSEDEQQTYYPFDQKQDFRDAYFDTMFYRTYIGIAETDQMGGKTISQYQMPCYGMKHFYAQYISPYPKYAYAQGHSAVVIAKYYEGAFINGTIQFLDSPIDYEVVVQQNITHYQSEIPVDHDRNMSVNGSYEVIVPAGEVNLQVRRYPELGDNAFVMVDVTFGENGMHPVITEEEATRAADNYRRYVDINIPEGFIEGYVYDKKCKNSSEDVYNESVDRPIANATVMVYGIESLDPNQGTPTAYDFEYFKEIETDENGYYNVSSLLPGYYQLLVKTKDGFEIENTLIPVHGGNNWYNVSKPEFASVEGIVYYDESKSGEYDSDVDEILDNTTVRLIHTTTDTEIANITTDDDGFYSFEDLYSGNEYTLKVLTDRYAAEESITPEENETMIFDISVGYAPVEVNGNVLYENEIISDKEIKIQFTSDLSVDDPANNTAVAKNTTTDENGYYSIDLIPGFYNITINHFEGNVLVYTYKESSFYVDMLKTEQEENITIYDKHSATITGFIVNDYDDIIKKAGITLNFEVNNAVENNIALEAKNPVTRSDGSFLVELTPEGYYNISVYYTEGDVIVYTGSDVINNASDGDEKNITLTKESVTFYGEVKFNDETVSGIDIVFVPDDDNAKEPISPNSDENGNFSVELSQDASYNVTVVDRLTDGVIRYTFSKIINTSTETTLIITLTKHTVNVSGNTQTNESNIGGIEINFMKNESVVNNTAISSSFTSDKDGHYYLELKPGHYNVSVNQTIILGNDTIRFTYAGKLNVEESISMAQSEDIIMKREIL